MRTELSLSSREIAILLECLETEIECQQNMANDAELEAGDETYQLELNGLHAYLKTK